MLNVSFSDLESEISELSIVNTTGQTFYSENFLHERSLEKQLDLSYLPKGIYFLRVRANNKQYVRKIFVI